MVFGGDFLIRMSAGYVIASVFLKLANHGRMRC
jgi:hypothetical protein